MRWFAAGATLSAFARFNYFLFPSLYSDWVFTGDFLRLGFCLLMTRRTWSTTCTGRRIVRPWSAIARVTAWRIHHVAYVESL